MRRGEPAAARVGLAAGLLGALVSDAALGAVAAQAVDAAAGSAPLCRLSDERIDEASGFAAAGGRWWTHDDSRAGGAGRLYALDEGCRTVAVVVLPGTAPRDAEDLAVVGAGSPDAALWLADVGDNRARREGVALHRIALPRLPPAAGRDAQAPTLAAEAVALRATYADGARDAEALLVDPAGSPVVVTKPLLGRPGVYAPVSPPAPGSTAVLRRAGEVRLGARTAAGLAAPGPAGPLSPLLVTGGAVAADGGRVALTTYTDVHEWLVRPGERRPGGGVDLPGVLARSPDRVLPLPALKQAEAVAYAEDGRSLLVTGEGAGAPVHRLVAAVAPTAGSGDGGGGSSSGTGAGPGVPGAAEAAVSGVPAATPSGTAPPVGAARGGGANGAGGPVWPSRAPRRPSSAPPPG